MTEDRKFTFGKYRNQEIKYIILTHIGYIMWCLENLTWFGLNDEEQALYDAVAIMIKRENLKMTFPVETMYKHIKNREALEKLSSPFFMHNGVIATDLSEESENPICASVKKYITSVSKVEKMNFPDLACALSHSLNKDIVAARDNNHSEDDIFGGWKEYDYGHC